jgi:hypothetical protein
MFIVNKDKTCYLNLDELEGIYIEQDEETGKYIIKSHTKKEYEIIFDEYNDKCSAIRALQGIIGKVSVFL